MQKLDQIDNTLHYTVWIQMQMMMENYQMQVLIPENPDNKYAGVEIPGDQEYVVWNEVIVQDAGQLGTIPGLICLTAEGEFYNPVQKQMTVSMRLENLPIGQDLNQSIWIFIKLINYVKR